jgi:POT family proton-dependent oligopeptide transporter
MQNPYGNALRPGALGLGQANASSISYGFTFWMYLTPVIGGIIADSWLGRYRTICYAAGIYVCGLLLLFVTALPYSLEHGAGLGGFIAALFLIGSGAGGIKANVSVLIFEQYTETKAKISTLPKTGERVIVDPQTTISNIYMIFYNVLCVGCLSGIPATYIELQVGFWAAYLVPFCAFWIAVAALVIGRKKYGKLNSVDPPYFAWKYTDMRAAVVRNTPQPVLGKALKALGIAIRNGFKMDAAKPSYQAQLGRSTSRITWDDKFVDELKRGLYACRVL